MLHFLFFPLRKIPIMQSVLAIPGSCPTTSLLLALEIMCFKNISVYGWSRDSFADLSRVTPASQTDPGTVLGFWERSLVGTLQWQTWRLKLWESPTSAVLSGLEAQTQNERICAPAFAHAYCLKPSDSFQSDLQSSTLYSHVDVVYF